MNKKSPRQSLAERSSSNQLAYAANSFLSEANITVDSFKGVSRSYIIDDFSNLDTYISGRPGLTREHYEAFRYGETVPTSIDEIIKTANLIYKKNGLVRSVLDLMSDFACEGIRIAHPNKTIEKFYNKWFETIKGQDRSERFLSNLYRSARVIVRSMSAAIPSKRIVGADVDLPAIKNIPNEIPIKYVFLNPLTVGTVGGKYASFIGSPKYYLKPQQGLFSILTEKENVSQIFSNLPAEIKQSLQTNKSIPLDPNKTFVFHYKKDDWDEWAVPFIYPIFGDVIMLNKLKLADSAALDGAISKLRILKIGNLEYKIAPTSAASAKLSEILESHTGGGTIDIIWGPDIELIESNTDVYQFLGDDKYVPHLNAIYDCLGIPSTLTASGAKSSGTTNNYISLKTLIRRLDYGREKLKEFWDEQIQIVQKSMGFAYPGRLEFNFIELGDDAAQKALLIQLADRNILSEEYVQRVFGGDPDMETIRTNREERARKSGRRVNKSSPYHDPQFDVALQKIALQKGYFAPEQLGINPLPGTEKKRTPFDKQMQQKNSEPAPKDGRQMEGERGRPRNSRDKEKRKEKEFKPKLKAMMQIWANDAQNKISELMKPLFLTKYNKRTLRELNAEEAEHAELVKFGVLSNIKPFTEINMASIIEALKLPLIKCFADTYYDLFGTVQSELKTNITLEERRSIQSLVYSIYKGADNG